MIFNMEKTLDLGFAKLDLDRKRRTGCDEVVFCQGKTDFHLVEIYRNLLEKNGIVFGTRAVESQFKLIKESLAGAAVEYDDVSKILIAKSKENVSVKKCFGNVAVCCAGTADIPVAEEASKTAEFFGAEVNRFYDIGVSCLNRILEKIDEIRKANAVVVAAGMEGSLPSVLGGLVCVPVVCVPTSVGYGTGAGGTAALLSMLNSCANGISVVNIDNGYGAGYIAAKINALAEGIK